MSAGPMDTPWAVFSKLCSRSRKSKCQQELVTYLVRRDGCRHLCRFVGGLDVRMAFERERRQRRGEKVSAGLCDAKGKEEQELLTSLEGTGVGASVTTIFVAVDKVSPGPARIGAGRRVGRSDGSSDGLVDGRPLGLSLGLRLGLGVGLDVGGSLTGLLEGLLEGRAVPAAVGRRLGRSVAVPGTSSAGSTTISSSVTTSAAGKTSSSYGGKENKGLI